MKKITLLHAVFVKESSSLDTIITVLYGAVRQLSVTQRQSQVLKFPLDPELDYQSGNSVIVGCLVVI